MPGLVVVAYALATRMLPMGQRTEWFLGGDHVRHLLFVAEERAVGNLSYADQVYPRAWHTLLAAMWSTTGAGLNPAGLRSLVEVMASATWCLPAVLSIATGALAVEVATRSGLSGGAASATGLLAAAMVLWPPFLSVYQALGFENSLVGAIVLAVVARQVINSSEHTLRPLLVVLGGTVVCAHTWQLLLPAVGVAVAQQWSRIARTRSRANVGVPLLMTLLGAWAAFPGVLAVVQKLGIQHATDAGVEAPLPVALLLAGLISSTLLAVRGRRDCALALLWLITVVPALTAVSVALRVGIGLSVYYPSKLLWHSAALGLVPLAVVAVAASSGMARHRIRAMASLARVIGPAVLSLVVAFALVTPAGAFVGAWSTSRGREVVAAITSPGAAHAQVVWLGARGDDTISRILLDFYRVDRTRERTPQPPLNVAEECELLRAATRPTVLSSAPPAQVRTRYACISGLRVVGVQAP
jgi:hypothetical protein